MTTDAENISFQDLINDQDILNALNDLGYETPSPIQIRTIPVISQGQDVLGQAQTGTGKTAAFALPSFSLIDLENPAPQVLIMVPTRELAIQVAEAYQQYGKNKKQFAVVPIYGGQGYDQQIRKLKRGVQVVVGTPGRLTDLIKKEHIHLDQIKLLVLDEADEMLKMDFQAEVEWILAKTPETKQTALLSATVPKQIQLLAQKYLKNPEEIKIEVKQKITDTIEQRMLLVDGKQKLAALTRVLEILDFDGMIIFVRTKRESLELTDKLEARGFKAAPLNGDLSQQHREQTIRSIKSGKIDILIATDVAARGIDIDRIDHILNYDIPLDTESYIHRIGRTGRAGRKGKAILLLEPRERQLLKSIERAIQQKIETMQIPTSQEIQEKRIIAFKNRLKETIEEEDLTFYKEILADFFEEHKSTPDDIAAALAKISEDASPLIFSAPNLKQVTFRDERDGRGRDRDRDRRRGRDRDRDRGRDRQGRGEKSRVPAEQMDRYKIQVGRNHGVKPGQIVGTLANEGGINGGQIGPIEIFNEFSVVYLAKDVRKGAVERLYDVKIGGKEIELALAGSRRRR